MCPGSVMAPSNIQNPPRKRQLTLDESFLNALGDIGPVSKKPTRMTQSQPQTDAEFKRPLTSEQKRKVDIADFHVREISSVSDRQRDVLPAEEGSSGDRDMTVLTCGTCAKPMTIFNGDLNAAMNLHVQETWHKAVMANPALLDSPSFELPSKTRFDAVLSRGWVAAPLPPIPHTSNPSGRLQEPRSTGPFGGALEPRSTGLFGGVQEPRSTGPFGGALEPRSTGPFGGALEPRSTGPFGGALEPRSTGPFGGALEPRSTGPFGGALEPRSTGPFGGALEPRFTGPYREVNKPVTRSAARLARLEETSTGGRVLRSASVARTRNYDVNRNQTSNSDSDRKTLLPTSVGSTVQECTTPTTASRHTCGICTVTFSVGSEGLDVAMEKHAQDPGHKLFLVTDSTPIVPPSRSLPISLNPQKPIELSTNVNDVRTLPKPIDINVSDIIRALRKEYSCKLEQLFADEMHHIVEQRCVLCHIIVPKKGKGREGHFITKRHINNAWRVRKYVWSNKTRDSLTSQIAFAKEILQWTRLRPISAAFGFSPEKCLVRLIAAMTTALSYTK